MIAYNSTWLDALLTRDTAHKWHHKGLLSDEQWKQVQERYQAPFYTPNVFVRIGLAFFCMILLSAAIGLFMLFTGADSDGGIAALSIFFGLLSLAALELWAIGSARHFGSGVDDMLLYFAISVILTGLCSQLPYNTDTLVYYCIALPFLLAASIRYLDRLLAAATFICMLMILLLAVNNIPRLALYLLPFSGMLFSAGAYFFAQKGQLRYAWRHWHRQLVVVEMLALATFYMSGNYWIVQQAGAELFQLEQVPMADFFWLFTFIVPVAYILIGLFKKDRLMMDIGLGCIAAAVFTFRYFFHVMPLEWAAVIGGAVLFATAYFSIQYLRKHEGTYTYAADGDITLLQEIEEQLIEQTIASQNPPTTGDKNTFGGGEFGGGGAGGEF
ncbi:MAG: hypothetical protein IT262_12465 [Saprospiraceae bacterium]|nr:hypothetical protein [Saprospiraceae bacterium]